MKNYLLYIFVAVLTFTSAPQLFAYTRTDFRDETIYFVMTTRFNDGDSTNNVQCWDAQGLNAGDPPWRGDFKGLIEKLDYIKALGFTSVWITPVVENCSGYDYHGYHAMNFKKVDARYLSQNVGFQELINAVHAKDMKIILDVVFNHTGNFGEARLAPMFVKDESNLGSISCLQRHPNSQLPSNYNQLTSGTQYQARLAVMKNTDGVNHDTNNHYHHFGNFNWDDLTSQWAQIAGDCVDLNTENPIVYNYLIEAYGQFIRMGVDGFRIDTGRHISRLVFNYALNDAFMQIANSVGKPNFFMFGEFCTRDRNYWYRNTPALSTPFYTWKESVAYPWSQDTLSWKSLVCLNGTEGFTTMTNQMSCIAQYNANSNGTAGQPSSNNAFLNGNAYRATDYSRRSNLYAIDFPMHWNFEDANSAFNVATSGDWSYNDATFNVVYVDSHDYAPDGAPESQRFAKGQDVWAENLSLMYTFRGIPCLYYGSEIEFKKGSVIDNGPNTALRNTGRAYYGGYIKGTVETTGFAEYSNATGNMAVTLRHPLSLHIQRLSKIRMAVPALRKGQYSTSGCSGALSFKRRYTDATTDSYVLVTISGNATFSNILNGTYVDAVTGDTKIVSNNTLTASCSGKGNMRVYVLNTALTPAPGQVGNHGKYLYQSSPVNTTQGSYPDDPEALTSDNGGNNGGTVTTPCVNSNEQAVFFEKPASWGNTVYTYVYYNSGATMVTGSWPGQQMQSLGNNVYKYTFDAAAGTIGQGAVWYVLFSDGGGNQTAGNPGFVCEQNALYNQSGKSGTITVDCSDITSQPTTQSDNALVCYSSNRRLFVTSPKAMPLSIFASDGRLLRRLTIDAGSTVVEGLPQGLYFVNGQKVVVF